MTHQIHIACNVIHIALAICQGMMRVICAKGAGLIRVRSPLLAESRLISFTLATKMFQFARLLKYMVSP